MRRVAFLLALALFVLVPAAAHAQSGTIAGNVVEEGSLTPLFGATPNQVRVGVYTSLGTAASIVATDAAGHYSVPNLAPGSYYVRVLSAPGHVPETHNNIPCIALDCTFTSGHAVTVAASATTTVDFALAKEGLITGTVRRAVDNSPIGSVTVTIYNPSTSYVTEAITASDGTYVAKGLATGTYFARTVLPANGSPDFITELYGGVQCPNRAPESDCRIAASSPIAVTAGSFTNGIDFSLDKGATVAGNVTVDGASYALAGVTVNVYAGDLVMGTTFSDSTGNYTVRGLPAGRYRVRTAVSLTQTDRLYVDEWQNGVCIGCPGAIPTLELTADQDLTGVNFALATGGSISGTVTCTGPAPQHGHRAPEIAVFTAAGQLLKSLSVLQQCLAGTPATYTVPGLPTGTYFLWARDYPNSRDGLLGAGLDIDQLYGGLPCNTADCDVRKGVPVTVTTGATTSGIDFVSQRGVSFTVENVPDLKIYDARGVEVVNAIGFGPSPLVATHLFVAGLPPGTYFLTSEGRPAGVAACLGCPPTVGVPVIVGPNGINGAPTFAVPSRRVSGTITSISGSAPLSTVSVELVTQSGRVVGTALSDLFGRYTLTKIAAGTYFARTVNDRGFIDKVYTEAGCTAFCESRGTPIVVPSDSDVTGRDFALQTGRVVSGVVTDTEGNRLANVPVSLFGLNTIKNPPPGFPYEVWRFAGRKATSATGKYRLSVTSMPYPYRAFAEATTGHKAQLYSGKSCPTAGCDPENGTDFFAGASGVNFALESCSATSLTPSLLATGVVGVAYRQVFSAVGGTGPYVFRVTDGQLPLSLKASTGELRGSPTAAGRWTFRVSALDSTGCATDRTYVLDVQACAFTLSPSNATVAAAGGNVTVTISNACGSQEVVESSDWVSVQSNSPGQITLTIAPSTQTASRIASIGIGRRAFEVRQAGTSSQAPYGLLDVPGDGAQVSGAVAIGGWALDDLEVTNVRIFRDNVVGEPTGIVFLGNAVFIPGARPDVQQVSPGVPRNDRAGFGFLLLTNTLPNQGNGNFRIHAVAEDGEGHQTLLGSRTIVSNNTTATVPFGTIDTPGQGQTISGSSYINFGWALTPQPAMIPTDGSTMQVIIDGVPVGTVDYNHFRPDVSNTFPGLANSGGPVGFRAFDTTALSEGLHTISWSVTDSRPATAGLGSRYFIVANSADAPAPAGSVTSTQTDVEATEVAQPLGAAAAPDSGRRVESLAVAASDEGTRARTLTLAPMERIELTLDALLDAADDTCPATWAGYLKKDNVLSDLPVGAALDPAGTFYWQTGPGFAGRFPLVFVRTNCRGEKQQAPVTVTIPIR